ncbi:MAG: lipocalin family protein [Cyclobacteriaceae bacterium]
MKRILTLLTLLVTNCLFAQKIDKHTLCQTWYLDKYSDEEEYYLPPKKEEGDYMTLRKDMTYEAQSEGTLSSGTWMLNTNGKYLELKDGNRKVEKLYVYFASDKSLVVVYDVDEYRIWEVHYVSSK